MKYYIQEILFEAHILSFEFGQWWIILLFWSSEEVCSTLSQQICFYQHSLHNPDKHLLRLTLTSTSQTFLMQPLCVFYIIGTRSKQHDEREKNKKREKEIVSLLQVLQNYVHEGGRDSVRQITQKYLQEKKTFIMLKLYLSRGRLILVF